MADKKRVVTRKQRAAQKGTGKFHFTREMVPVMSNGKQEPEFLTKYRKKAWKAYERTELPKTDEEAWRRTDLRKLETDSLKLAVIDFEVTVPEELIKPVSDEKPGGQITLTPVGTEISLDPELVEKGVVFTDFETAAVEYPEILEKILGQIIKPEEDKFSAMAAAFSRSGVLLFIPRGVSVEKPLQSLLWAPGEGKVHFSHLLIWLEEGASAKYVHEYSSPTEIGQSLHSGIVEIYVGRAANLLFIEIQSWGNRVWSFTHEGAHLDNDATLEWVYGALGSRLTKNFSNIDLIGQGATGRMAGFYFSDGVQHLDHDTQQNHMAPSTTSDLLFKGALKDNSRSVWQGMIYVAPGAQKSDGYQSNPNLVLDKEARADSIPGLEIMADDVRCSHGATVGKIDPSEVFYLNSRGIPKKEAERLIIEGFFDPILQRIPFVRIRERMQQLIIDKLN
jgi:Fe-S cluster assembly protein SufD